MLKKISNLKEILIISLLSTFTVFIFAPLDFFLANSDDLFFSFKDVLSLSILFFAVSYVALCLLNIAIDLINNSVSKYVLTVQTALTVALYIQGNFLRTDYGELDGEPIDWSAFTADSIISILVWLLIIAALVIVCIKLKTKTHKKVLLALSLWVLGIQLLALFAGIITSNDLSSKEKIVCSNDCQFDMAADKNFIILVIDTFDSPTFYSVYNENPDKYAGILEDFTYYRNTSSMYQYTTLSLPYIFSGVKCTLSDDFHEYIEKQYHQSPLLQKLTDEGYRIGIYSENISPQEELPYDVVTLKKMEVTVSSRRTFTEYYYRLLAYRYAPFHLKQVFWFYPEASDDNLADYKTDGKEVFHADDFIFYNKLDEIKRCDDTSKAFFFYHLDGTHPPFNITDDFSQGSEETSIESESRGVTEVLINDFLSKLKEEGVYDNSAIIIMGDHGYTNLRQSPVLMIKGLNEHKDFEVSDTPVSFADLQYIFSSLIDDVQCGDLFDEEVQKNETRLFYHYGFDENNQFYLDEYVIPDDAFDAK